MPSWELPPSPRPSGSAVESDQQFGALTVLQSVPPGARPPSMTREGTVWRCSCVCGRTVLVRHQDLLDGSARDCGRITGSRNGDENADALRAADWVWR
jgi:hypothetical protein